MNVACPSLSSLDPAAWAAALLDPARAAPAGWRAGTGADPARRFAVYRNNVVVSRIEALADAYPVLRALLGDQVFRRVAREYVRTQPADTPVMREAGAGLGGWLAAFAPLREWPYLADVARLEHARVEACHAADAPVLAAEAIACRLQRPAALPGARLVLQPSCRLLASPWAVVSLWSRYQGEAETAAVPIDRAEAALVLREPDDAVLVVPVATALRPAIERVIAGAPLAEVQAALPAGDANAGPRPTLTDLLLPLIRHHAIVDWIDGDTSP